MADPIQEIDRDFTYHAPNKDTGIKIGENRDLLRETCRSIMMSLPPSREASLFKTKMEEAMFWSNACLARYGYTPPTPTTEDK